MLGKVTTKDSEEYHAKCFKMVSTDNDGYLVNVRAHKAYVCIRHGATDENY